MTDEDTEIPEIYTLHCDRKMLFHVTAGMTLLSAFLSNSPTFIAEALSFVSSQKARGEFSQEANGKVIDMLETYSIHIHASTKDE